MDSRLPSHCTIMLYSSFISKPISVINEGVRNPWKLCMSSFHDCFYPGSTVPGLNGLFLKFFKDVIGCHYYYVIILGQKFFLP